MIKEAAIQRRSDGTIWTGHRHGDVIKKIYEDKQGPVTFDKFVQGFITDKGIFVDRRQAFKIAVECKQIKQPKDGEEHVLISEDLY